MVDSGISTHIYRARTIVDDLGDQYADGDGQLEHEVGLAGDLDWSNLPEVQRYCLGGKACTAEDKLLISVRLGVAPPIRALMLCNNRSPVLSLQMLCHGPFARERYSHC